MRIFEYLQGSPDSQAQAIFTSTVYKNRVVSFPYEEKTYRIRLIHNPVVDPTQGVPTLCSGNAQVSFVFIIAPEPGTPRSLVDRVKALLPPESKSVFVSMGTMNGQSGFELLDPENIR